MFNSSQLMFQVEKMQSTVAGIENDAVWWLQETALRIYRPSATDFVHALHKVGKTAVLQLVNYSCSFE
jgi:hypothetical protein